MKLKKKEEVNNLVINGHLPIAFFNSKIIDLSIIKEKNTYKYSLFIDKYKQIDIPRPNSNKHISKIYDFF
ncbi:hypothetical protein [Tenacibaculum ovolyticum]|uniref:hypothetical protein n=1 Tax=Tenacibaculum ovolyticum TaxID=104270 RepID=UPI0007ED6003|nr:hypothetical protein [Tenacibaculum ovolyticum]